MRSRGTQRQALSRAVTVLHRRQTSEYLGVGSVDSLEKVMISAAQA